MSRPSRFRRFYLQSSTLSPRLAAPYLPSNHRSFLSAPALHAAPTRTQDFGSPFSFVYDPSNERGRGPIFDKTSIGVPEFYPKDLKRWVDQYVVGQDRAKKTICSAIFNHYQGLRRREAIEVRRKNLEQQKSRQDSARRDRGSEDGKDDDRGMPEDESSEQSELTPAGRGSAEAIKAPRSFLADDSGLPFHVETDKSNLLLLGPTGVGKTYILETLSKKVKVPFAICDCNGFTQAGYIGQDVESCIERLLVEANYDIKATERGIIILDEFDKIARKETVTGRDVGGEGVQQALLKMVEGTKVTVNVKENRSHSRSATPIPTNFPPGGSSPSPLQPGSSAPRVEQFTIDTSNILFVFCGAFVGLDKIIRRRVAKPVLGFGSHAEVARQTADGQRGLPQSLYAHLPHQEGQDPASFTPLDLASPADFQSYGFIPELIGRIHNVCSLSPLTVDHLFRILTEPRNNLVAQYISLFETYPSRLYFTRKALYAIATRAAKSETGARGLKMEMERVLAEPMFDAPVCHVLITEDCVNGKDKAGYWAKDGLFEVQRRIAEEDEGPTAQREPTFESYREAGHSGG